MAARIQVSNLQPAKEPVVCRADIHIDIGSDAVRWDRLVTLRECCLYRSRESNELCLGMPQRNYTGKDGKTKYAPTVDLPRATHLHAFDALKAAWEAQGGAPEGEPELPDPDPFAE